MEQISNEALWGKLSEIDKKLSNKTTESQVPQLSIDPILEKLEEVQFTLAKPSIQKHWHSIEIKSSKVFIALIGLSLFLLTAIIWKQHSEMQHFWQLRVQRFLQQLYSKNGNNHTTNIICS